MPTDPEPLEIAARALRHRDRSRRQLDERLARAGVGDIERAEALETLERVGYLDERRYAQARAAALAQRGFGDDGIRQLLAKDGLPQPESDEALADLPPERDRAAGIVARLGRGPRTAAHLGRKGFGEDAIAAAASMLADESPGL